MKQVVKILIVLLIGSMTIIPFGNAQNRGRGHQGNAIVSNGMRTAHRNVNRNAHANYNTLPRWGAPISRKPSPTVKIRVGNSSLFYNKGIYYTRQHRNYVVERPVRGFRISVLPAGFRTILLGDLCFYYYFGTFYEWVPEYREYEVVAPPLGAIVDALPEGYEIRNINGYEYYYFDGTYYAEVNAPEFPDGVGYQVVQP
ncbi:MAG: DUF6515 family protein [Bacteroidota bacterium]|nr:DUF6515 family protein [Bacteroidota bacterium]